MTTLGKRWIVPSRKAPVFAKPFPLIRTYLGKYQKYILLTQNRAALKDCDRALESFLGMAPKFTKPEQFDIVAVEDYKWERQRAGITPDGINRELKIVKEFWDWMTHIDQKYARKNVCSGVKLLKGVPKQKRRLTHEEHSRLLAEMYEPWLRVFYAGLVRGETVKLAAEKAGLSLSSARRGWSDCASRANLAWVKPSHVSRLTLELSRHRLASEIFPGRIPSGQPASLHESHSEDSCTGLPSLVEAEKLARVYTDHQVQGET